MGDRRRRGLPAAKPADHDQPVSDAAGPRGLSAAALAAMLIAAAQTPLASTMIAVALPTIAGTFAVGFAATTGLLVTAYMILNVVGQSPGGKLADALGRWRTLQAGIMVCAVGALIGALTPAFWPLVAARALIAIGGALIAPAVLALMRAHSASGRRGKTFGLYSAAVGLAAAIGPPLGGELIHAFGWRAIFAANLPFLALALILIAAADRAPEEASSAAGGASAAMFRDFDWLGALLLAAALALLASGARWAAALAALAIIAFAVGERRARDPILDPALFANRVFAAGSAVIFLQSLAMYGLIFQLPQAYETLGHATPRETGHLLLVMMAALFVASLAGGALADRLGAKVVASSGTLLMLIAIAWLAWRGAFLSTSAAYAPALLIGIGLGATWSPAQSAAMSAIPEARSGAAGGATSASRYLGGAVGALVVAIVLGETEAATAASHAAILTAFCAAVGLSLIACLALPGEPRRPAQARR
jgi:MFS family permease